MQTNTDILAAQSKFCESLFYSGIYTSFLSIIDIVYVRIYLHGISSNMLALFYIRLAAQLHTDEISYLCRATTDTLKHSQVHRGVVSAQIAPIFFLQRHSDATYYTLPHTHRYTNLRRKIPDSVAPVVMRRSSSVEDFCNKLHRAILRQCK